MKKLFLLFSILPFFLSAQNTIVWDFDSDTEGWQRSSTECTFSWEPEGAIKLLYNDDSGDGVVHAQVRVEKTFDAALYPYIEIYYKTEGWPSTGSTSFMAGFHRETEGNNSYIFTTLDPKSNYVCVKISDAYINWGPSPNSYEGTMKAVILEIPHNSVSTNPSAWNGASVTITKVVLTDTPTAVEPRWTFDADLEGWKTYADNVDIALSQQDGKMRISYVDGAGGAGYAPLNTPRIVLDGLSVDASGIDTFKMSYTANWPVPPGTPMPILLYFTVDAGVSYSFFNIDPESGDIAINIRDHDPKWGAPLDGIISRIDIEIPHNSATNANNGDLWFNGSYIDIDQIELVPEVIQIPEVTEWSFDFDLEGWGEMQDGIARDVEVSWKDGAMIMTYKDKATTNGPQLWFPQATVATSFDTELYPYCDIHYETVGWPTTSTVSALLAFTFEDNSIAYSFFQLNPADTFICVDIAKFDPGWGTLYSGKVKSVYLELPHNSSGNPATAWFGASTRVKKIKFTHIYTVFEPEPEPKLRTAHWTFDENYSDSIKNITGTMTGTADITDSLAKTGEGALMFDGNSYLTLPADTVFRSENISYTFWLKTPAGGQENKDLRLRIFSHETGKFDLALYQGNLTFSDGRLWQNLAGPWQDNIWKRIAIVVKGNELLCYVNGSRTGNPVMITGQDRTGAFILGQQGLAAIMDELSIYNYALSPEEAAADGWLPPITIAPWTFDTDLEGWKEIQDGNERDVNLSWENGAMVLTYADNAVNNGPQLWFPQVEVFTNYDADLYPYCDIHYETVSWPVTSTLKALLEFTLADGSLAYSYFDLDPSGNFVRADIINTDPGWGTSYSGKITRIKLEIPHNGSATPAEPWFGASVKITKIELNNTPAPIDEDWDVLLQNSAFVKAGMERLNYRYYQYLPIGLGGTAMRVDPWGFGFHTAPGVRPEVWHHHEPYFGYEYWWDREGHRFNPFRLKSGYGATFNPGTITSFQQNLDISTGMLTVDLGLKVDGISFTTKRNVFITPEGVLVIRVQDSGAPSPIQLNVEVEKDVRIYNNMGIYSVDHDPWTGSAASRSEEGNVQGGVVSATRPGTSDAALAVAVETGSSISISGENTVFSTTDANGVVTFYIAPASSFNPATPDVPWDHAWNAAYAAKQKGYEVLRQETAEWWQNYYSRSKISIPDEKVARLYAQSLYYHGVYFGETAIPPGCNSTDIESFAGAICPEYDLTFSSLALAYTGHLSEAKNIADWVYSVLPKAKQYATEGVAHHDVYKKYSGGAKYTTLTGFDGALTVQPVDFEGRNLHSNYPGTNAALMALTYLDYSDDDSFRDAAHDILQSTTYVALEDLMYDARFSAYRDTNTPSTVQQGSARMGYEECVKRGIALPAWEKYENKILIPTTTLNRDTLIAGGVGALAQEGVGDATWLQPVWWNNVVSKHDPVVRPSYENAAKSSTGDYVFNSGTMGVIAAKLYLGNEALSWLQRFQRTDILYDETCFSEVRGQFNLTPEIGAHGAYISNLSQMLIDPDNDEVIDVFPAIPDLWEYKKVSFSGLMTKGGISVSAERDLQGAVIQVTNASERIQSRQVRIKVPRLMSVHGNPDPLVEEGFIIISLNLQPGETKSFEYNFSTLGSTTSITENETTDDASLYLLYPNPNSTGILNIENKENVEELVIFSLNGNIVKRFGENHQRFDIADLETGFYIVRIKANNKFYPRRLFVVNH